MAICITAGPPGGQNQNGAAALQFQGLQQAQHLNNTNAVPAPKPEPGTLIVVDQFTPTGPPAMGPFGIMVNAQRPHGELVDESARAENPDATVARRQISNSGPDMQLSVQGRAMMSAPGASGRQYMSGLQQFAENQQTGLLNAATQELEDATAAGAKNTAMNISQGSSKAAITASLYREMRPAWDPNAPPPMRDMARQHVKNAASAFYLDEAKLVDPNPLGAGAKERGKLQQALIDSVDRAVDGSDGIKQAQQKYSQAVTKFESGNNSLVVAGENDGDLLKLMEGDAAGQKPRTPANFYNNVLSTRETTTVGAVEGNKRAEYTGNSSDLDILASGSTRNKEASGNSFAAPRVAARMADIHKQNPQLSSSQVENLLRNQLTHKLEGEELPVLNMKAE